MNLALYDYWVGICRLDIDYFYNEFLCYLFLMRSEELVEKIIEEIEEKYVSGFPGRLSVVGESGSVQRRVIEGLRELHPDSHIDSSVRGAEGIVLGTIIQKYDLDYFYFGLLGN